MTRRAFITALGGAAACCVSWPLTARAQPSRIRRIGVLMTIAADDPESPARLAALLQGLQGLGWIDGRNMRVEYRWAPGGASLRLRAASELVALEPDVIVANGSSGAEPLLQVTRTVPIVFVLVPDPVGAGLVDSLARPGGNATGFMSFDFSMGGKWLEVLKQAAPHIGRIGVLRDSSQIGGVGQFSAIQSVAPAFGIEVIPINVRDADGIEAALGAFARSPNGGLIVTASALAQIHRDLIFASAAKHRLPAIYWDRALVARGGLMSYGPDLRDQFRLAAGYVDRILKGEKPAELPVQAPTKFATVINLRTAKAIGLEIPPCFSPAPTR
jgi:putative ABC transport system substrate-binding protein